MSSALCPLCSTSVPLPSLETHLRVELRYASIHCLLCPLRFFDRQEAEEHFRGRFAEHPGEEVQMAQKRDRDKERRLGDLIDQALGETGPEEQVSDSPAATGGALRHGEELRPRLVTLQQRGESELRQRQDVDEEPSQGQKKSEATEWRRGGASDEVTDAPVEAEGEEEGEDSDQSLELVDTSIEDIATKKHVKKCHPNYPNTDETLWTSMLSDHKDNIVKVAQKCFPGTNVNWATKSQHNGPRQRKCEVCGKKMPGKSVSFSDYADHVTRHHWKTPLYSCRLCTSYKSTCSRKSDITTHLKTAHNAVPSPATLHSVVEQHEDAIADLVDHCFPRI